MSRKRRNAYAQTQQAKVQTPVPTEANIPLSKLEQSSQWALYFKIGAIAVAAFILWVGAQAVMADEPAPPTGVVIEDNTIIEPEETAAPEPVVEEKSKIRNAMRYLFKDDASAIVSEVDADLQERQASLDAKEAQLAELEQILRNEETVLGEELTKAQADSAKLDARVKALTQCVAKAMDEGTTQ